MGDIRVGASVLSEKMRPVQVIAKSDAEETERVFELRFSDGSSITAGSRQQWLCRNNREPARVWTSLEMFEQLQSSFRIAKAARDGMAGEHVVSSITEVDPRPMQCVEVDSESHLYLVGESMVPTHDSFLVGGLPV
jgi:hypothetical protein